MKALSVALVLCLLAGFVFAEVGVRYGIEAGAGVDKISLGDSESEVRDTLGSPDLTDEKAGEQIYAYYSGFTVLLDLNSRVRQITIFDPYDRPTQEGLKIGDPRSLMLTLYGKPEEIMFEGEYYCYWSKGIGFWLSGDKVSTVVVMYPTTGPIAVEQQSWGKVKAMFR